MSRIVSRWSLSVTALLFPLIVLSPRPATAAGWATVDIGHVGTSGSAEQVNGVWTIKGAGGDIWGGADAFRFVYTNAFRGHVSGRIDSLENTNPFAKAGVMFRSSINPDAATVILDVKPNGEIEFMERPDDGGEMTYLGGTFTSLPIWLDLAFSDAGTVVASFSKDNLDWTVLSQTPPWNPIGQLIAGAAVTSHDASLLTTARIEGLSFLFNGFRSTDIGNVGAPGNALWMYPNSGTLDVTIQGAGADIWGTADSFQFVHAPATRTRWGVESFAISLGNTNPFAKAGLMFRDGLSADAAQVMLDVKPNGELEFMARLCRGCETTYLSGGVIRFGDHIQLTRNGNTFTASAGGVVIGSVDVALPDTLEAGWAVTSHVAGQLTTAVVEEREE